MKPKPHEMEKCLIIMSTTCCNANCNECGIKPWMKSNPGYHTSLEDIERLIYYTKLSSYTFPGIYISGGEALLWKNLIEGLKMIRASNITPFLKVASNGIRALTHLDLISDLLNYVDVFRVTRYYGNEEAINKVISSFPGEKKLQVETRRTHWVLPKEPIEGSLPADCGCRPFAFVEGKIDLCVGGRNVILNHDWNIDDFPYYITGLKKNYLDSFKGYNKYEQTLCKYCVSNHKVQGKLKTVKVVIPGGKNW